MSPRDTGDAWDALTPDQQQDLTDMVQSTCMHPRRVSARPTVSFVSRSRALVHTPVRCLDCGHDWIDSRLAAVVDYTRPSLLCRLGLHRFRPSSTPHVYECNRPGCERSVGGHS